MADKTGIEWTDATWNPVRGCSRVSEGCRNCYAESVAARFSGPGQPYEGFADRDRPGSKWTGKLALVPGMLDQPLRWRRPRRIFVNSMSDLFHENLPDEAIDAVFGVMALAQHHTFQVLTKRADRMRAYMANVTLDRIAEAHRPGERRHSVHEATARITGEPPASAALYHATRPSWPLPNVQIGVSVEDQKAADQRIPDLLAIPAAKRFLSCEPLLGPVWLRFVHDAETGECIKGGYPMFGAKPTNRLDWVIAGGESGPGARPMHPDWARSLRDQCADASVPFFFKQWGDWAPADEPAGPPTYVMPDGTLSIHGAPMMRVGKKAAGHVLDGATHLEVPA